MQSLFFLTILIPLPNKNPYLWKMLCAQIVNKQALVQR